MHPEEHSAIEFDQVESYSCMKLTAIHLESQERVGSEIAESLQVESVDQVNVQIEELLLSENLDNSKVSIPVNSEANMIQQESVIPGIAASSSTRVSYPEISSLREEFSIELPAVPAPIEFPEYDLMCPDVGDKQASPVSCEHEAAASDNFNDKISSSEDISEEAPSSKEITDEAPYSEDITDKSSSSEDIIDNAPSSEDITDKVPSKEDI